MTQINSRRWSRNPRAGSHIETMLVSASVTIVLIRLYLSLTGYPQVGGGELHIAHALWGGLLMIASLVIAVSYISAQAWRVATMVGGVGFGLFIDEIGKYITRSNDYFYRPAVSIIYVTLTSLFLVSRFIHWRASLTDQEIRLNKLINNTLASNRWGSSIKSYQAWASGLVSTATGTNITLLIQIANLCAGMILVFEGPTYHHSWEFRVSLISALFALILTMSGFIYLRRERNLAYNLVQLGSMISLLFVQVFSFYQDQRWALMTLTINVIFYSVIKSKKQSILASKI